MPDALSLERHGPAPGAGGRPLQAAPWPWAPALSGLLTLAVSLAAASMVAALAGWADPVVAVGDRVVDASPRWLEEWAIDTFGTGDKRALLTGIWVLLVLGSLLLGRLAWRRLGPAVAGVGAFGVFGAWASASRTAAGTGDWVAPLVGSAAGGLALAGLVRVTRRQGAPERASQHPPVESPRTAERRRFLVTAAGAGTVAAFATAVSRLARGERAEAVARSAQPLPVPSSAPPAAPEGAAAPVGGVEPYLTPTGRFYRIDTALVAPQVDATSWSLDIGGMVDHPLRLGYEDLRARPLVERTITLCCVSNEVGGNLVGNARWTGVLLADLLREAGVQPGAGQVVGESVDGWTAGFPLAVALDGRDAMVAIGMNGEPLPVRHGFPARLVVPGLYGYVSATKWLRSIIVTGWDDFDGYWVPRGWSKQGPVKTQSRIDVPRRGATYDAGPVAVGGVAWAQHRGIAKVEVRVDDGPWHEANLADEPTVDAWRQWWWQWDATPGEHRVWVRATDHTGATQPERRSDVAPDGATGWHNVPVTVR